MKKLYLPVALLLALCAPLSAMATEPPAPAAPGPLTQVELLQWRDDVWREARTQKPLNSPEDTYDPQGAATYLIQLENYTIESSEPSLDAENNPILSVTLNSIEANAPRGLGLGSSLETVLAAYPNGNPTLTGNEEFAALYLHGLNERANLPEAAWGLLMRDNRNVLSIEYAVCAPIEEADAYTHTNVSYIIGDQYVTDMRVDGFGDSILAAELEENLQTVRDIAESTTYNPDADLPPPMHAEMFGREDLQFSGLDFLTQTPEAVRTLLGPAKNEENVPSELGGPGSLRMTYPGLEFEFAINAMGRPDKLTSLLITDPNFTGPRGLCVGDGLEDLLRRFRLEDEQYQEPQTILYSPGENIETPPFGLLEIYSSMEATVRYAMPVPDSTENEAIMLHITVEGMHVSEVLIYRWKLGQ